MRDIADYHYPYNPVHPQLPGIYVGVGTLMCGVSAIVGVLAGKLANMVPLFVAGACFMVVGACFQLRRYAEHNTAADDAAAGADSE